MVLVRSIQRNKWRAPPGAGTHETAADAVTHDLRTTDNRLSFWRCADDGPVSLETAVLAIVAGRDRLDIVDVVWVEQTVLHQQAVVCEQTPGCTPATRVRNTHVDASCLDLVRHGCVAKSIADSFRADRCRRYSKAQVRELLVAAAAADALDFDSLKPSIREAIEKARGGTG